LVRPSFLLTLIIAMTEKIDKDRVEQWRENILPVESAERLKSLANSADSRLAELCRELFDMLDAYEVSDSGRGFHPTTIQSCRVMHCARLGEILPEMKKLSSENASDVTR